MRELYLTTRVLDWREYRAATWPSGRRSRTAYGWGRLRLRNEYYDSYNRDIDFRVPGLVQDLSGWPTLVVKDRRLEAAGWEGRLLGLARYSKISVALDVTRGAAEKHAPDEWTAIAASARVPGLRKQPVSVYLAEVCPTNVLRAIARGAG
ncbi:MAG: hypothetical protein KatS3mg015_3251 [Fimbriimonadales bacterium]|nr:MAG: hypothetical protein KatS3mg015_3251 [Fimbriimonadales bacterium]